jgi:membrane protein implicated in regulation of membrane protease activity
MKNFKSIKYIGYSFLAIPVIIIVFIISSFYDSKLPTKIDDQTQDIIINTESVQIEKTIYDTIRIRVRDTIWVKAISPINTDTVVVKIKNN